MLPISLGGVAAGVTKEDKQHLIGEAIDMPLVAMREDGDLIPEPTTVVKQHAVA